MIVWIGWAALLVLQNAAFTWVSRARNSGSLAYHATASVFSNGIWIFGQTITIGMLVPAINSQDWIRIAAIGGFYTTFTVIGSVSMHHILSTYVERGKRKVGA